MDLCFYNVNRTAKLFRGIHGLVGGKRNIAARHGNAVLSQQLLRLVLMNIHRVARFPDM
jgi:hypothetical protein